MVLKDCNRCVVYTPKGKRFSDATVEHSKERIAIYFDEVSLRDMRMRTVIDFFDNRAGMIRATCDLVIHRNPAYPTMTQMWMADCSIADVKNVVQRQKDIRIQVERALVFKSRTHDIFFHGVMRNISAGGLYLTTDQTLDRNEVIEFRFQLGNQERTLMARAIRATKEGFREYGYGCCFINLTDSDEAAIREYVYKALREKERRKVR